MGSPDLDRIAQVMAAARSRRGLIGAFAGGMVAALFAGGTRPAAAQDNQFQCMNHCETKKRTCIEAIPSTTPPVTRGELWTRCERSLMDCRQRCRTLR
jgi:hypothetical protein